MLCWRAKKWTYAKACYRIESDKEEPCMKIVNTEEFNALMNEDAVLVDFFATWCGPCKMLGLVLEKIEDDIDFNILKVDVDKCNNIASEYNIYSVPTLVLIRKGKEIKKQKPRKWFT